MPAFEFRKSSYSDEKAECVEIATNVLDRVAIRDSKKHPGPCIQVSSRAWSMFRSALLNASSL